MISRTCVLDHYRRQFRMQQFPIHTAQVNNLGAYESSLEMFIREHLNHENVVGVIATGSIGRGSSDALSDVDFVTVVKGPVENVQEGKFIYNGHCLDNRVVHINNLRKPWSIEMKEAYGNGRILVDRTKGSFERLVKKKAKFTEHDKAHALSMSAIRLGSISRSVARWRGFNFTSEMFTRTKRGDLFGSHLVLNGATEHIFRMLYALNGKPVPEEKHRYNQSKQLEWRPENFERDMRALAIAGESDFPSLVQRCNALDRITQQLLEQAAKEKCMPENIYEYYLKARR